MIEYKCNYCGLLFLDSPSAKRKFCSYTCSVSFNKPRKNTGKGKITKECPICKNNFTDYVSNNRNYCSRSCFLKFLSNRFSETRMGSNNPNWVEREPSFCEYCGEPFERHDKPKQKYCSFTCMGNARKGSKNHRWVEGDSRRFGVPGLTGRYKQWKKKILARDNYTCQKCGSKEELHTHHIKSWTKYPDLRFIMSNGIVLCKLCHYATPH